ncbi:MAG: 3-isopropylmalate dehydratase large subunit [Pseudobdellovibrionaceae bacterium]
MGKTLYQKVWQKHAVKELPSGATQLFIGLHLIHEVTSPQAFEMLRKLNLPVAYSGRTFATVDHIIPTTIRKRPFVDELAEEMFVHLEKNCKDYGIPFLGEESGKQGIVHVIGPELGLTQPGQTIACGDSHTSTHGAFGSLAFGIGTSQVRDVLATQTLAMDKFKVRRINVNGKLGPGVYAKDVVLHLIRSLGVKGGIGFAYEYGGSTIENMSMEERMTICNMAIEGGARIGYINPDQTTFDYIKGRLYAPKAQDWDLRVQEWKSLVSDPDAVYDDVVNFDAAKIPPTVTWGVHPGQAIGISENLPLIENPDPKESASIQDALEYMQFKPGQPIKGEKISVAFIGSCTNSRLSDLQEVAKFVKGKKVSSTVKAIIVPGSMDVQRKAQALGLHEVFRTAGFEWREPGCSMCLAMNPDKLVGDQLCASSSNRNFKGRQGSPTGRTLLMSPVAVAASAIAGAVADPREIF